jgi:hypothetical protein
MIASPGDSPSTTFVTSWSAWPKVSRTAAAVSSLPVEAGVIASVPPRS